MIKLKTDCDNCIHSKVCGRKSDPKSNPKDIHEMLVKLTLGKMDNNNTSIDISCLYFEKIVPIARTVDVSKYVSD